MGTACGVSDIDKQEYDRVGLISRHAYSVLDVKQLKRGTRLVKLRNPWGNHSWTGRWSDASSLWTPKLRKKLLPDGVEAGVFWMAFEDMICYFDHVDVCKVRIGWN